MRKKKTPEELAREAEAEDEDEFTSECINGLRRLSKRCSILQAGHNRQRNEIIKSFYKFSVFFGYFTHSEILNVVEILTQLQVLSKKIVDVLGTSTKSIHT